LKPLNQTIQRLFTESYGLVHAALPGTPFFGFTDFARQFTKPWNYQQNPHGCLRAALCKSTYLYIDFSKLV